MTERANVFELTQIGIEATAGTAVPATKKLLGTTIQPRLMFENMVSRARGSRFANVGVNNREWSEATITQELAQYVDTSYLLAGFLGLPDITTPGGGTLSRNHTWDVPTFHAITPKPLTVETGGSVRAQEFPYGIIKTLGETYTRAGVSLSGEMFGRAITDGITMTPGVNEVQTLSDSATVSGGTFTITFKGETTAAIAFDATAAQIQTALLLLPNLDTGDVVVTGGPNPATDVVITFGGKYASINVPLMTVNSGSLTGGGTYGIVQTTAGSALSELDQVPISGNHWDIYVDASAAALGSAQLTRCFSCSWNIADLFGPVWPGNSSLSSFAAHVDLPPTTEFKFMVEADSTGMGFLDEVQEGDKIFARIASTGTIIEAAIAYYAQRDFAVTLLNISPYSDHEGVVAIEYTGEISHDSTWGQAASFLNRNELVSIT